MDSTTRNKNGAGKGDRNRSDPKKYAAGWDRWHKNEQKKKEKSNG